jgi:hypothetical protein
MSDRDDFVKILTTGINLRDFGFDDRSVLVFTKIMVGVLSERLSDFSIYRVDTDVFYEGGSLFLRLTPDRLEFRTIEGGLADADKSNAGRFSVAVIKFVSEASMSVVYTRLSGLSFDGEEESEETTLPIEKAKSESPTQEEDSDDDWWL